MKHIASERIVVLFVLILAITAVQPPAAFAYGLASAAAADYTYYFIPDNTYTTSDTRAQLKLLNWGSTFRFQDVKWLGPDGKTVACGSFCVTDNEYAENGYLISSTWEFKIAGRDLQPGTYTAVVSGCNFVYQNNCMTWGEYFRTTFTIGEGGPVISGNAGTGGAVLSYLDGTLKSVTAGSDGAYQISVPNGWSGTLTPSKPGYMFIPLKYDYTGLTGDQTGQDFTAAEATYVMLPLVVR